MANFGYYINLDERGEFQADVRGRDGVSICEIEGNAMFEDGYMRHKNDLEGLESYLRATNLISAEDRLMDARQFEELESDDGENDD